MYAWSPSPMAGGSLPSSTPLPAHVSASHVTPPYLVQLLPNSIARNPCLWTKDDVRTWLQFCSDDFSIEHVRPERFDMNGKALCLLNRKDFMERDPSSGDLLYNALQRLLVQKNEVAMHSPLHPALSPRGFQGHGLSPMAHTYRSASEAHQNGVIFLTGSGNSSYSNSADGGSSASCLNGASTENGMHPTYSPTRAAPYISILPQPAMSSSHPMHSNSSSAILSVPDSKPAEVPESVLSPAPTTDPESTSSDADSLHNDSAAYERSMHESADTTYDMSYVRHNHMSMHTDNIHNDEDLDMMCRGGEGGDCRLLWEFIYQLLQDRASRDFVCWEGNGSDLVFRIVNPTGLAELWGQQKNRTNMTYEKLSRALRYYYKMNIIKKVAGKRLTYKFLQHPSKIQKGQRGAKPHCMRNLPNNPPQLAPHLASSPLHDDQYISGSRGLSPAVESRPPSLSPAASEDLTRAGLSPSSLRRLTSKTHSLPPTPVHMVSIGPDAQARLSVSPSLDDHVRLSLKDHLHVRQLLAKTEVDEELQTCVVPDEARLHLKQNEESELMERVDGGSKMDYQEEPEDLSMKPIRGLSSLTTSSSSSSSSSSIFNATPYSSESSLSTTSNYCLTPRKSNSCPSSPQHDHKLSLVAMESMVVPSFSSRNCHDGRNLALSPEATMRADLTIVKSEPLLKLNT